MRYFYFAIIVFKLLLAYTNTIDFEYLLSNHDNRSIAILEHVSHISTDHINKNILPVYYVHNLY